MKIDFDKIEERPDFEPLPAGKYLAQVVQVEEKSTSKGDAMWRMKFQVAEGEFLGRFIFDNMVFSQKAMNRVKLMCSRLGIDVTGEIDLQPEMLKGKAAILTVEIEEYDDATGNKKKRNTVPYAGYERADGEGEATAAASSEARNMPF